MQTKNAYELISDNSQQFKIINSAYKILYENKSPRKIIKDLTIDLG